MIDVEPLLLRELERRVPLPGGELADWDDALARAGVRRRRALAVALATAVALLAVLAATPLGGAVVHTVGGFSEWLTGSPGEPAAPAEQRRFERPVGAAWDRRSRSRPSAWRPRRRRGSTG